LLENMTSIDDRSIALGYRHNWGGEALFALRQADRRQHAFICGQTGTGKSSLLFNAIVQDMETGAGLSLIEPHGDLAMDVLRAVPRHRVHDVVYFDPSDLEHPFAYNILAGGGPDDVHLIASGIVSACRSVWADSWGPRLEYLLHMTLAALIACCQKTANVSILGIPRMLIDSRFREWVLAHVDDVIVQAYWRQEFEGYDPRLRAEVVSPLQNKIGALLSSPPLRNTLGQVRKAFDLRFIMDRQRIFIANLAKGKIGAEKSNLLGSLLIGQFEQAALSRANLPIHERVDHNLYVDEVHNYPVDATSRMMSEARKFRCNLTLGCQHTAMLLPEVRDAIFGNAGTILAFRTSEKDAAILSREFGGAYLPEQFTDLPNFEVLVKLLESGSYREPFRGTTLPPLERPHDRSAKIIARCRERFATPRKLVEERIKRWLKD